MARQQQMTASDDPQWRELAPMLDELIERSAITHVNFTASFYRHLLTRVPDDWRSRLRVVAVGGEACRTDDLREHAARLPAVALDHEYGPTESTVWCSAQRLHPPVAAGPSRPPFRDVAGVAGFAPRLRSRTTRRGAARRPASGRFENAATCDEAG